MINLKYSEQTAAERADIGRDQINAFLSGVGSNTCNTLSAECFVPTGIPALDRRIGGGLKSGEFAVLCAYTGYGKSSFCVHLAGVALSLGIPVILGYSEMTLASDYLPRLLAWKTGVPYSQFGSAVDQFAKFEDFLKGFQPTELSRELNWEERLRVAIDCARDKHGTIPLVLVDSMDKISSSGRESLESTSEYLAGIARDEDVALWATTQANDKGYDRDILDMSCIRDSRGKAFPASFVFGLGASEYARQENIATVTAMKTRRGNGFTVRLRAELAIQRFTELNQAYEVLNQA